MLNDNGDTTICFSVSQSKYLLKQVAGLNECDSLLNISELQLTYCDSIFKANDIIEEALVEITKKKTDIELISKSRIDGLQGELNTESQNTLIEKNKKRFWMGATALVSSIFCYYVLTHAR